jgi:ABC-2 type transport system permease protein
MMRTLLCKEFREQWRTWKAIVFLVVFLVLGMLSPVLAKYTPELLKAVPNLPAGLAELIPAPTLADSVAQYVKNTVQFGILLVLLLTMGVVVQEKERGTAAMLLVRPIRRSHFILSKWLAGMTTLLAGFAISTISCYAYTFVLFEALPAGAFILLNLLLFVYLGVYLSITLLASTVARSQTIAASLSFGALVVLLILGALPRVAEVLPGKLAEWGSSLVLGGDLVAWSALGVSLGIIALCLLAACLVFRKTEI